MLSLPQPLNVLLHVISKEFQLRKSREKNSLQVTCLPAAKPHELLWIQTKKQANLKPVYIGNLHFSPTLFGDFFVALGVAAEVTDALAVNEIDVASEIRFQLVELCDDPTLAIETFFVRRNDVSD